MVTLANVQFGKNNEDVRTVQRALIARGRGIPAGATGHFDEQTKAAYAAEQRAQGFHGNDADGIPGCATLTQLGRLEGFTVDCRAVAPTRNTPGRLSLAQVTYHDPNDGVGKAAMEGYARTACSLTGMEPAFGIPALVTISLRESSYNAPGHRINTSDGNNRGPIVADGHRQNCSRGAMQVIPPTFAEHHQAGTATTPYDVVADMCAAINYVRSRYRVNKSGSNFAARVQQADPHRPPHPY